jgi:bacillithiol system protein YtxJ
MKNWKHITTESDIHGIVEASKEYPQIIFKDSVTCGISAFAKERLIGGNDAMESKAVFNYLDLLKYRSISSFIAAELNVIHQSPQVIVLKDGQVVHTVTHHSIEPHKIVEHL